MKIKIGQMTKYEQFLGVKCDSIQSSVISKKSAVVATHEKYDSAISSLIVQVMLCVVASVRQIQHLANKKKPPTHYSAVVMYEIKTGAFSLYYKTAFLTFYSSLIPLLYEQCSSLFRHKTKWQMWTSPTYSSELLQKGTFFASFPFVT